MSWLVDFVPGWVKGLFDMVAFLGKLIVEILRILWMPILFLGTLLAALFDKVMNLWELVSAQFPPVITIVTNSATFARAAADAGWPPELASALYFANQHVPLGELFAALTATAIVFTCCLIFRSIKSLLPSVN